MPRAAYFGILSAVIVLASWVISNTISTRLAATRSALNQASNEDALRQRLESIRRGYREIKAPLSRVDLMLSEANPDSIFSTFPRSIRDSKEHMNTYALLTTAETHFFAHDVLQEEVYSIRRLTDLSDLPSDLSQEAQNALRSADLILQQYSVALERWDAEKKKAVELVKRGNASDLNAFFESFGRATQEYINTAAPLQEQSMQQSEKLVRVRAEILYHLTGRLNRLKTFNGRFEVISWILYALGTVLAILGKWLEVQEKRQTSSAQTASSK